MRNIALEQPLLEENSADTDSHHTAVEIPEGKNIFVIANMMPILRFLIPERLTLHEIRFLLSLRQVSKQFLDAISAKEILLPVIASTYYRNLLNTASFRGLQNTPLFTVIQSSPVYLTILDHKNVVRDMPLPALQHVLVPAPTGENERQAAIEDIYSKLKNPDSTLCNNILNQYHDTETPQQKNTQLIDCLESIDKANHYPLWVKKILIAMLLLSTIAVIIAIACIRASKNIQKNAEIEVIYPTLIIMLMSITLLKIIPSAIESYYLEKTGIGKLIESARDKAVLQHTVALKKKLTEKMPCIVFWHNPSKPESRIPEPAALRLAALNQ